ncbi:MAG: hypothetical protein V2A61_00330, partial [Calditrichota bacterium]
LSARAAAPMQLGPGAERVQEALEAGVPLESEMTAEGRSAERLHDQVVKFVNEKPETAAKLVRSWLIETEYGKRIT